VKQTCGVIQSSITLQLSPMVIAHPEAMGVTEEKKRKSKELTVEDAVVEESHKKKKVKDKSFVEEPIVEKKKNKAADRDDDDVMPPKKKLKSATDNRGRNWKCECGESNRAARRNCQQCKKQNPTADTSGDWVCPKNKCGQTNFAGRNKCFRCKTQNLSSKEGFGGKPWHWTCRSCSFSNFADRLNCKQCNIAKPTTTNGTTGESGEQWTCRCSFSNFASRVKCKQCNEAKPGAKPERRENSGWACCGCGYLNFASRLKCKQCSAHNTAAAGTGGSRGGGKAGKEGGAGVNWDCCCGVSNSSFSRCCNSCGAKHVLHRVGMSQMPVDVTEEDIKKFFSPLEPQSVKLIIKAKMKPKDGEPQGKANVLFNSHQEAVQAMAKDQVAMGSCNVKLYLDSTEDTAETGTAETNKTEVDKSIEEDVDDTLNETTEADESTGEQTKKKFKWDKLIKSFLKTTDDKTMSVKKLRKVLLPMYREEMGKDCSEEEFKDKLEQRLNKSSKLTYKDGTVSL